MQIGELAHRTGVVPRLLRYYEEQGLLRPCRSGAGYREYDEPDVDRVRHIRTLLTAGLSTATIAELLPCMGPEGAQLIADCPELLVELNRERARLDHEIAELERARQVLDVIRETASPDTRRAAAQLQDGAVTV